MNNVLKIHATCRYAIVLILSLLIVSHIGGITIGHNATESLPYKYFLVLDNASVEKGDYVVFNRQNKWYDKPFVKQIIGIEGDSIHKHNNSLWIMPANGENSIYAGEIKEFAKDGTKLYPIDAVSIPKNKLYVFAPHRQSLDSRYKNIGLIDKKNVKGRAIPLSIKHAIYFVIFIIFYTCLLKFLFFNIQIISKVFPIILLISLIFYSHSSWSKDLGVHGKTYKIKETDLAQDIKTKVSEMDKKGELDELQKKWLQKTKEKVSRPSPVLGLTNAIANREYYYDPSITVKDDIFDHQGRIIAKKGTRISPLTYQNLTHNLLFIDGDNDTQIEWALEQNKIDPAIIILTNGNIMSLMKEHQTRIYFDQGGHLVSTFEIKALPARISQEDTLLKIQEVAL